MVLFLYFFLGRLALTEATCRVAAIANDPQTQELLRQKSINISFVNQLEQESLRFMDEKLYQCAIEDLEALLYIYIDLENVGIESDFLWNDYIDLANTYHSLGLAYTETHQDLEAERMLLASKNAHMMILDSLPWYDPSVLKLIQDFAWLARLYSKNKLYDNEVSLLGELTADAMQLIPVLSSLDTLHRDRIAALLYRRGSLHLSSGHNTTKAKESFLMSLKLFTQDDSERKGQMIASVYIHLGIIERHRGNLMQSEECFRMARNMSVAMRLQDQSISNSFEKEAEKYLDLIQKQKNEKSYKFLSDIVGPLILALTLFIKFDDGAPAWNNKLTRAMMIGTVLFFPVMCVAYEDFRPSLLGSIMAYILCLIILPYATVEKLAELHLGRTPQQPRQLLGIEFFGFHRFKKSLNVPSISSQAAPRH